MASSRPGGSRFSTPQMVGDVVAQPLAAAGAAIVPAIEHPEPASPAPGDQAFPLVLARPLLEVRMQRQDLLELAALKPYVATLEPDRVVDGVGEDDGVGGGPQLRVAVIDALPHLLASVGA